MVFDAKLTEDTIRIYEREQESIHTQVAEICVFMNGGVDWNVGWGLSYLDRAKLIKIYNKKSKAESGSKKEYM